MKLASQNEVLHKNPFNRTMSGKQRLTEYDDHYLFHLSYPKQSFFCLQKIRKTKTLKIMMHIGLGSRC